MTRLLKRTALLMSLLLLTLTLCGLLGRPDGGGLRGVLVLERDAISPNQHLHWVVPGTAVDRVIPYPFTADTYFHQVSPNARYQFWRTDIYSMGSARSLYRIDLTTGRSQLVTPHPYFSFHISPDRQWLVLEGVDSSGSTFLYRMRVDGRDGLNLTAQFAGTAQFVRGHTHSAWTQISPDSQWVYFTGAMAGAPSQIYRVPLAGGPIEQITHAAEVATMEFWPAESAWPLVWHDNQLFWMRPDGGELQPVLDMPKDYGGFIVDWLPDEKTLIVQGGDRRLWGVRLGDDAPVWQIGGPYRGFFVLDGWVVLYGGAVARMRPDGTQFMELAGQTGSDTATLMGLALDEPALIIFRDFPGTSGRNPQRARLADGHIQAMPVSTSSPAADLLADLDWESPYIRQVMDILTTTNLQPHRAQFMQDDFVALGPPIDRKLSPIPLILIAGGLLVFGLAPRRLILH